ncbi:glycosyltransferase 87 family protein [uncultured Kocuria sp.]|uniref:glycosyltransferase 87 family protein n=1 Tax=uncultured Kocuria sp. TaxID=259305 RepID=UPI00261C2E9E|nr:glycosyltransferase 87 family protein [uncultured Kocuria sp.]
MSPQGGRSRGGHDALLVGLSLYTVMTAWLLRLPCRVPGWGAEASLPALCTTGTGPGEPTGAGGFFTGGPAGDQPALVGMITTVVGWLAARLSALFGADVDRDVFADLSVLLLALVWIGTAVVVSALSGRRGADAFVLALAPVAVLVGFSSWDQLAVLLMVLALLLHVRGRPVPAGIVLGLAASVALFPLVVLLAVLLLAVRYRQFRDFAVVLAGTVVTWALVNGPFLLSARDRWARQFGTPGEEPVAGSSLWGVWARVEQARTGAAPDPAGGAQYVLLALVLGFVAVLVLTLLTRQEPSVVQIAFLLLAVLVLSGPGYSLVHVLWLAPLVLLSRRSWPEFAAWQLVEVLWWTTLVLPEPAWPVLPGLGPIGWDAQDLLAAVRVLLLVLLVVAVAVDVLRGGRARRIGLSEPG